MASEDMIMYEDHVRINILDDKERQQLAALLLNTQKFEDVVLGIEQLCVKFDPEHMDEREVQKIIADQIGRDNNFDNMIQRHHILPMSFDNGAALDIDHVIQRMNMTKSQFMYWFLQQNFYVQMMGFQPGFAYLSHDAAAPKIERLDTPRSKVIAGSIGFLGTNACIYAHDGPGGWPIIGRTNIDIFDVSNNPPNLLNSGDKITFGIS